MRSAMSAGAPVAASCRHRRRASGASLRDPPSSDGSEVGVVHLFLLVRVDKFHFHPVEGYAFQKAVGQETGLGELLPVPLVAGQHHGAGHVQPAAGVLQRFLPRLGRAGLGRVPDDLVFVHQSHPYPSGHGEPSLEKAFPAFLLPVYYGTGDGVWQAEAGRKAVLAK